MERRSTGFLGAGFAAGDAAFEGEAVGAVWHQAAVHCFQELLPLLLVAHQLNQRLRQPQCRVYLVVAQRPHYFRRFIRLFQFVRQAAAVFLQSLQDGFRPVVPFPVNFPQQS